MRFLLRILPSDGDARAADAALRGVARSIGGKAVNSKTTSYGAVELDIFLPSRQDFDLFLAAIEPLGKVEFHKDLQEPAPFLSPADAVAESVDLFNGERFWEAHEVLESVWRVANGEEKRLLQGLILVCAAFVHEQKGERTVAVGVAKRAVPLLAWEKGKYHGLDIAALRVEMERSVSAGRLSLFRL